MLATEAKLAVIMDGKAVAARVRGEIAVKVRDFAAAYGRAPGLAVVQVGNNPASSVYVRNKKKEPSDDSPDNSALNHVVVRGRFAGRSL